MATLAYITWDVDPVMIDLGFWQIRWYGLLFAMSFVTGYYIVKKMFAAEKIKIEILDTLTVYVGVGTILGARLGHCLFYEPDYYLSRPLEILYIWKGGLASHGAAVGILLALWLFVRKVKKPYLWILDKVVVVVALAGFFIRTGNLMNSEIYGIPTDLPWGFLFVRDGAKVACHPTQIYESLSYIIIFALLMFLYFRKKAFEKQGLIFGLFLILLFSARFFIEFIKDVQVNFEQDMTLNMGQWLSIPFVLAGFFILFRSLGKTKS